MSFTTFTVLYVCAYLVVLFFYFFSETSGNLKRRSVNKIILALMFFGYAAYFTLKDFELLSIGTLLLIALFFCMVGDILLLKSFSKGGMAFSAGNITLLIYIELYLIKNGVSVIKWIWFVLVLAAIFGGYMALKKRGFIDFGKMDKPFSWYLFGVTLHGSLSIVALFFLQDEKSVLLFAGSILYMISDYFISIATFKYPDYKNTKEGKLSLRLNSLTYFVGLILIAVHAAL